MLRKRSGLLHQRRELRHQDAAGGRGEDRVVAAMPVELLEGFALGFQRLGHAFEDQLGRGQRARRIGGRARARRARRSRCDLRGVDHAELREARKAGFDLGPRFGAQLLPGLVAARAQVDQRDAVARVGEGDRDAAPHAARADGGEARRRRSFAIVQPLLQLRPCRGRPGRAPRRCAAPGAGRGRGSRRRWPAGRARSAHRRRRSAPPRRGRRGPVRCLR